MAHVFTLFCLEAHLTLDMAYSTILQRGCRGIAEWLACRTWMQDGPGSNPVGDSEIYRVVPDFGSNKSEIRPFFGNLAKSGSSQISSRHLAYSALRLFGIAPSECDVGHLACNVVRHFHCSAFRPSRFQHGPFRQAYYSVIRKMSCPQIRLQPDLSSYTCPEIQLWPDLKWSNPVHP